MPDGWTQARTGTLPHPHYLGQSQQSRSVFTLVFIWKEYLFTKHEGTLPEPLVVQPGFISYQLGSMHDWVTDLGPKVTSSPVQAAQSSEGEGGVRRQLPGF